MTSVIVHGIGADDVCFRRGVGKDMEYVMIGAQGLAGYLNVGKIAIVFLLIWNIKVI